MPNKRGNVRREPDPVAIASEGRVTSTKYRKNGGKKVSIRRK